MMCDTLLERPADRLPYFRIPLRQLIDMHEQSDEGLALTIQLDRSVWLVCESFFLAFLGHLIVVSDFHVLF